MNMQKDITRWKQEQSTAGVLALKSFWVIQRVSVGSFCRMPLNFKSESSSFRSNVKNMVLNSHRPDTQR